MRTRRYFYTTQGQSYDLSISDLMTALCCIFLLVAVAITASLLKSLEDANIQKDRLVDKNEIAQKYRVLQHDLYLDLQEEFRSNKDIVINPNTLSISFPADTAFMQYSAKLSHSYENILSSFFPKLLKVLQLAKYKDEIEEIRIEGFTSTDASDEVGEGSEHDYTSGIVLSQERTQNVLLYCLSTNYLQSIDSKDRAMEEAWVRAHISASGFSFSKPIYYPNTAIMDKNKTRRVEFRIKTNSDRIVEQLQDLQ